MILDVGLRWDAVDGDGERMITILVVDDDQRLLRMLQRTLQRMYLSKWA